MSLIDIAQRGLHAVQQSKFFEAAVWLGMVFLVLFVSIGVLLLSTFLLRRFFNIHEVNRAHKVLIYLFTMAGVLLLIVAGILGLLLPLIPGIPFLIAAILLMRKYHRSEWLESKLAFLRGTNQEKLNKRNKRRKSGGKHARTNN